MTNATKSQSNGGTNVVYQDLPQVIKTLKNEPDDDFTKPNLTQWDKEQKVPLINGNVCAVIMCKVIVKTEMILNKVKYSVRMGKCSTKHNTNGKSDDNIRPFVEWKTRKKIPHNGNANRACKENMNENIQTIFKTNKLQT